MRPSGPIECRIAGVASYRRRTRSSLSASRLVAVEQLAALRQHRADDRGQVREHGALVLVELARRAVDHAHGADALAAGHHDGRAGIEADVGIAGDQRVVGKARVARGVGHLEQRVVADRVVAERDVARRLGGARQARGWT